MTAFDTVAQSLRLQAGACAAMGSPFSAALVQRAADALAGDEALQDAFRPWADADLKTLFGDAAALRWLGALHDAVLAEPDGALAAAYPSAARAGDPDRAWPLVQDLVRERTASVIAFMGHEPQTNEVRRSVALLPGFLEVAARTRLPLRTLELGASAGLNQLWDRRHYDLGSVGEWGPREASVRIDTDWRGEKPALEAPVRVVERGACDRRPVDITDPDQRRRLRAYIWADQLDRLERLDAAIDEALSAGLTVDAEDAVAWTRRRGAPRAGVATVVFHSVFFQYMPSESQAALGATLAAFGEDASEAAPLAWLRMEPAAGNPAIMELRLTEWPDGTERLLGMAHPHGAWVEWTG